jgi:hypothetical protein
MACALQTSVVARDVFSFRHKSRISLFARNLFEVFSSNHIVRARYVRAAKHVCVCARTACSRSFNMYVHEKLEANP